MDRRTQTAEGADARELLGRVESWEKLVSVGSSGHSIPGTAIWKS